MSNHDSHIGSILIAFATGALIGAGIALLYAPQSGEVTRKILADKAEELSRQACDKAAELKRHARESFEHSKEKYREKKDQFAAAVEAGKEGYREAKSRTGKEQESPLA